jgi:hypothetical protein
MPKFTVLVKVVTIDKKNLADTTLKVDSSKDTFFIEGFTGDETLADLEKQILKFVNEEALTEVEALPIPYHLGRYLYTLPPSKGICKANELIHILEEEHLQKAIMHSPRVDPHFQYTDLTSVINKASKKPAAWKGQWLDMDDLEEACNERGIDIPSSSDGTKTVTEGEMKDFLKPWHNGVCFHEDAVFQLFVVVAAKNTEKKSKKTKTKGPVQFKFELLPPLVYRNRITDSCELKSLENAGTVLGDLLLDYEEVEEGNIEFYKRFREGVMAEYKRLYPLRQFDLEALFYLNRANSTAVTRIDNFATLHSKLILGSGPQKNSIKVSVGAPQVDPAPAGEGGYPCDNNG